MAPPAFSTHSRSKLLPVKNLQAPRSRHTIHGILDSEWNEIQLLSKQYGISLGLPQLMLVKLDLEPGVRRICSTVMLECMLDSKYGAKLYYCASADPTV